MTLISVIVPVYKVEPYIRRCIDSILSQTFTDFELVLVDDGSPDKCPAICDEYALKDNRIHVIHQENGGLSAARNAGLDYAFDFSKSEWISFVDSDDWVHPTFLEYLYRSVKESGTKIGACSICELSGEVSQKNETYKNNIMAWDAFYLKDWTQGVVACNKLYEKKLFIGLRYPIGKIHEDEYLTYKLLAKAGNVSYINAELYMYFQNPNGIIKKSFTLSKLDKINALEEQCEFAKKNGYNAFYLDKREALLKNLIYQLSQCQNATDLSESDRNEGVKYVRTKLRKFIVKEWKVIKHRKEKNRYLECAFPKAMWCYWTCVGIIRKIKRMVKKDA